MKTRNGFLVTGDNRLLVVAAVVAGLVALSNLSVAGTNSGNPRIVTGFRDGPVVLNDNYQAIGQRDLTRGNWFITAKLFARNNDTTVPTGHIINCVFGSLPDTDKIRVITGGQTAFDYLPVVLTETIHLGPGGGTMKLQCKTTMSVGETSVNFIKMTAVRAGRLTRVPAGGGSESFGEGKPSFTSLSRKRAFELSDNAETVLALNRPKGRWLVFARGTFHNTDDDSHFADATCVLRGGNESDRALPAVMLYDGGDAPFFHLLTTEFGPGGGAIRLRCSSDTAGDHDPVKLKRAALIAMKVGKLSHHTSGGQTDSGRGRPRVVSGYFPALTGINGGDAPETVATVPVPVGEWTLYGRVSANQTGGPPAVLTTCTLAAEADFDRTSARAGFSQYMEMNVSHVFASPGVATIQCSSDGVDDQVFVRHVRIVAIRASALSNSPLVP